MDEKALDVNAEPDWTRTHSMDGKRMDVTQREAQLNHLDG
jgi:hypothetical protein